MANLKVSNSMSSSAVTSFDNVYLNEALNPPPMKIATLLIASCLTLVAPCLKAQDQVIVETNIAVSLKYHILQAPVPKGNKTTQTYQIFAVKNADIIKFIDTVATPSFSDKARLVHRVVYNESGIVDNGIFVEDDGVFHKVTSIFHDADHPNEKAVKANFNDDTGVGTMTALYRSRFNLVMAGTVANITRGLVLDGPTKLVEKSVKPKAHPDWMVVRLINQTFTLQGEGRDVNSRNGFVSGTIKYTGAKILK